MCAPSRHFARPCHPAPPAPPAQSIACALLATLLMLCGCGSPNDSSRPTDAAGSALIVFATASSTDVMREAGRRFEASTGTRVQFNFAASSTLAQQIRSGAPADIFLSASVEWMDHVERSGGLTAGSRIDLLGNRLVLIAPVGDEFGGEFGGVFEVDISAEIDVAAHLPGVQRIAMGDPAHVPAGRYARSALETLGWWSAWEPRIIPTVDTRAALRLVEIGEVDAGVVFATDAARSQRVSIIAAFPPGTHEPIVYPAAICAGAHPQAAAFLLFLQQDAMIEFFEQAGFTVLTARANRP